MLQERFPGRFVKNEGYDSYREIPKSQRKLTTVITGEL